MMKSVFASTAPVSTVKRIRSYRHSAPSATAGCSQSRTSSVGPSLWVSRSELLQTRLAPAAHRTARPRMGPVTVAAQPPMG
jgi:hypothetical protein